jgi:hypothetical protein
MSSGVLNLATGMLLSRFGPLVDFPDEVANTIANFCYRWILLTSEPALPRIVVQSNKVKATELVDEYRVELACKIDNLSKELMELREIRSSIGERAFSAACELFVDRHKYGISDPDRKSCVRRKVERLLKRTGEIPELLSVMKVASRY